MRELAGDVFVVDDFVLDPEPTKSRKLDAVVPQVKLDRYPVRNLFGCGYFSLRCQVIQSYKINDTSKLSASHLET